MKNRKIKEIKLSFILKFIGSLLIIVTTAYLLLTFEKSFQAKIPEGMEQLTQEQAAAIIQAIAHITSTILVIVLCLGILIFILNFIFEKNQKTKTYKKIIILILSIIALMNVIAFPFIYVLGPLICTLGSILALVKRDPSFALRC